MSSVATVAAWLLFALPAAAAVTIVGSRLLGTPTTFTITVE